MFSNYFYRSIVQYVQKVKLRRLLYLFVVCSLLPTGNCCIFFSEVDHSNIFCILAVVLESFLDKDKKKLFKIFAANGYANHQLCILFLIVNCGDPQTY